MRKPIKLGLWAALAATAWAGPVDFGKQELSRAVAARKLLPQRARVLTDVTTDPAESFRILPGQVSGGDNRGLMYGLIEAAEQIRDRGMMLSLRGAPAIKIRGVRLPIQSADLSADWYNSRPWWEEFCATLARGHFNRLNVVYGPEALGGDRNLETLRMISQTATDYALDFTLGIQAGAAEMQDDGSLKRLLAACPTIRGVQASFYRDWLARTLQEAGRRVTLELPESGLTPELLRETALPLRAIKKYSGDAAAGPNEVILTVEPVSDPAAVRKMALELSLSGYAGFEVDAPAPPMGEGSRLFYMLWGRLSYNPKAPESTWSQEAKKP
jgi:hypothetical protein